MSRPAAAAPAAIEPRSVVRSSRPRFSGTAATAGTLVLAALTFAHPSATRLHTWPWALLAFGLWTLPLAAILLGGARRSNWRLPSWPILTGLALLTGGAIASAMLSPFSAASLPRVWPTLGGAALLLWLHHSWSDPTRDSKLFHKRVAQYLAWSAAVFALISLLGWSGATWPLPWSSRNDIPFGHSTYTAGAMVALFPWIGLQLWSTRGLIRLGWSVVAIISILVLASTSSRGGVLGLGGAATFATLSVVLFGEWSRQRKISCILGLLALGVIVTATNPRLRELVLTRQWGESATESNSQRAAMVAAGLKLGAERPVFGWGPGTIPLAYPSVRAALGGGVENVLQLHSTPAQVWATNGLIGIAGMLFLAWGLARALGRATRTPMTCAAATSLIGYALMALTDHQMDIPAIAAAVTAAAAWLLISAPPPRAIEPTRSQRMAAVALVGGVAVLPLIATGRDLRARQAYERALDAFSSGHIEDARGALDDATRAAPHDPFFQHLAAASFWMIFGGESPPASRPARIREATTRLERSLATGAHLEFAHFNLGWLYLETGQAGSAARHFAAAAQLVPDKGGVYFGLGLALRAAGASEAAVRAFALEWINDPLNFTSPAWEIPALAAEVPAIRDEADRLLEQLATVSPPVRRVAQWLRWWWSPGVTDARVPAGWNAESTAFVAAWAAMAARAPLIDETNIGLSVPLYAAWRAPARDAEFLALTAGDTAFATGLARRARQYPDDFRAFLVAGTDGDAALVRTVQRTRPGYGVLALHPEGPPLQDAYVVQENRVATGFAAGLFPRKGWIPGRLLLAYLPENPR